MVLSAGATSIVILIMPISIASTFARLVLLITISRRVFGDPAGAVVAVVSHGR